MIESTPAFRVSRFAEEWKRCKGPMNHEVYGLNLGTSREAVLLVADLEALCMELASVKMHAMHVEAVCAGWSKDCDKKEALIFALQERLDEAKFDAEAKGSELLRVVEERNNLHHREHEASEQMRMCHDHLDRIGAPRVQDSGFPYSLSGRLSRLIGNEVGRFWGMTMGRLKGERDEASFNLGSLLAVIHRDGGHYQAEHGMRKATEDAVSAWADLMKSLDESRAMLKQVSMAFTLLDAANPNPDHKRAFGVLQAIKADRATIATQAERIAKMEELLRNLVDGLDNTVWSSWQTIAQFSAAWDAARAELANGAAFDPKVDQ